MSQPIHNRGTAAEQGAAIRRQFEEQQQKRFSSQIQTDRLHHRDTPPPDDESAAAARRSSSTRRKKRPTPSSRRPAGPESEDVTSDDGGARRRDSTRSKRDSLRKRSTIVNEPPPPSRAAAAASAEEEEEEAPRSKRGSRALRKEAEGGTAAAAAAPVAARKKRGKEARDPEKEAAATADEEDAEPAASHEPAEEEEHPSRAKEAAGAGGLMAALGLGGWAASNKKDHDGETEGEETATEKPQEKKKPVAAVFPSSGNGEGRRRNYAKKNGVAAAAPVYDGEGQPTESGAADPSEVPEEDEEEEDDDEGHVGAVAGGAAAGAAAGAGAGAAAASHRDSIPLEKKGRVYPLTGIDNLALMLEDAGYQTACFSVYLFKTKLDYDTVLDFFEKLAEAYPKYRYVCELNPSDASKKDKAARKGKPFSPSSSGPNPGRKTNYSKNLKAGGMFRPARWRVDETFDVAQNIKTVRAKIDGGDDDLFDLCGACLGDHFDFNKPLWEATLVHGLHTSEGARSALMIKIHHAFSDGQGMIQSYHSAVEAMANGMSVESKQAEIDSHLASASAKKKAAASKDPEKQGRDSQRPEEQKKIGSRNIKPTVGGTVSHSWHTIRGLYMRRRKAFTYPDSAGKDAARRYGAQLGKNERPSTRLYAHSDGISMSDIKLIREAFSTPKVNLSLNDVACALLSRALRIAAETMADKQRSGKVTDKRIAVFIPISKRPKGDWTLANYTTGAIAWFRFHEPSRYGFESLLMQVNREMNRIKRSHLPGIWYNVFGSFAKRRFFMMPNYPIARQIFQSAYREYNVFTNVPGPSKPITFGKHEAFSYHVLPPSSPGKSTLAMGAISYAGEFSLAVSCDKVREFDEGHLPEIICQAFQQASQELVRVAKEKME